MIFGRKWMAGEDGLVVIVNHARLVIAKFDDGFGLRPKTLFVEGEFFAGILGQIEGGEMILVESDDDFVPFAG